MPAEQVTNTSASCWMQEATAPCASYSRLTDFSSYYSREPMASPEPHRAVEKGMQRSLPRRRVRIHDHPDLSFWTDWFYGLLQGPHT